MVQSALEGKFSVPFQMASMIVNRQAGIMEFTDEFVCSTPVQDMMNRIETVVDPEIEALGKATIVFKIEMELNNGDILTQESEEFYRGGPMNPLTAEELRDKFRDAAQNCMDESDMAATFKVIENLDEASSMKGIISLVARP